jgi:hypothetical protein
MLFKEIIAVYSENHTIVRKNPVRTSKRTPYFTITKISWLMLFKEIIAVYSENHTIVHKNAVRTSKRTPHFTITKINWLTLFKKVIVVYSVNNKYDSHKYTQWIECRVSER